MSSHNTNRNMKDGRVCWGGSFDDDNWKPSTSSQMLIYFQNMNSHREWLGWGMCHCHYDSLAQWWFEFYPRHDRPSHIWIKIIYKCCSKGPLIIIRLGRPGWGVGPGDRFGQDCTTPTQPDGPGRWLTQTVPVAVKFSWGHGGPRPRPARARGLWASFPFCLSFMCIRNLGFFLIDLLGDLSTHIGDLSTHRDTFLPGRQLLWLMRHN
jgi:hypothetical protein